MSQPAQNRKRVGGVASAIVIEVDPATARVKLNYPWMSEDDTQSPWARVAVPMAGPERGMQFLPEVDDEVLVAFEQGDMQYPVVIGYLWSETDPPPRPDSASQRAIQTVAGHVLEFDDTEGEEAIKLQFKGADPQIEITADKLVVQFSDSNKIEFSSDKLIVQFSDSSKIELSASELLIANSTLVNINP